MVETQLPNKSDKTETILMAAQKRFAHYGLAKTSMTDIARDVDMSKASLYYYFTDKEAIFQEVIKKEQNEFIAQIEGIIASDLDGSELLVTYARKRLLFFQVFLNLSKLNADTLRSVKPVFAQLSKNFLEKESTLVKQILKKGIASGHFEKLNITEHAELFISLVQSFRSNLILRKDLERLTQEDFHHLEKQVITVAKIFSKGIKK